MERFLGFCPGAYGENRSHARPESTLLSDNAIRAGSARGECRLELYHPDAGSVEPISQPTSKLDLRFHLGSVVDDGPGFVDRHGVAPQDLSCRRQDPALDLRNERSGRRIAGELHYRHRYLLLASTWNRRLTLVLHDLCPVKFLQLRLVPLRCRSRYRVGGTALAVAYPGSTAGRRSPC